MLGASLTGVAAACELAWTMEIAEISALQNLAGRINAKKACGLARIRVNAEELPRALSARDGVFLKNRFRAVLGLPTT